MDIGNLWNSLYTSQLIGTQMYGLQSDPFSSYGGYGDVWQASPWQYGLQTGALYGTDMLSTWQNSGFMNTLNQALTKYTEGLKEGNGTETDTGMEVSVHKGNVLQMGLDKALVYLPEEQKIMIVQTSGNGKTAENAVSAGGRRNTEQAGTARTKMTDVSGGEKIEEKGSLVDQRRTRAQAAYRRTQSARQRNSLWAKEKTGI